jgi:hypothetical protein
VRGRGSREPCLLLIPNLLSYGNNPKFSSALLYCRIGSDSTYWNFGLNLGSENHRQGSLYKSLSSSAETWSGLPKTP